MSSPFFTKSSIFRRAAILTFIALTMSFCRNLPAIDLYVYNSGNETFAYGKIDIATGVYTEITAAISSNLRGLTWSTSLNAFYTTVQNTLTTIDVSGNLGSDIGTGDHRMYGISYDNGSGTLYSFAENRAPQAFGTINTSNAAFTVLTEDPVGNNVGGSRGGRMVLHQGTMYMTGQIPGPEGIFGKYTGLTPGSTFSQIGSNGNLYRNMVLASDGTTLYGLSGDFGAGNQRLYSIDPASGSLTLLHTLTGANLKPFFLGADIVPVPEPSTCALAGVATLAIGIAARRKRKTPGA